MFVSGKLNEMLVDMDHYMVFFWIMCGLGIVAGVVIFASTFFYKENGYNCHLSGVSQQMLKVVEQKLGKSYNLTVLQMTVNKNRKSRQRGNLVFFR
jgi:hypothetical protein